MYNLQNTNEINQEEKEQTIFQTLGYVRVSEDHKIKAMSKERLISHLVGQMYEIEQEHPQMIEYFTPDEDVEDNEEGVLFEDGAIGRVYSKEELEGYYDGKLIDFLKYRAFIENDTGKTRRPPDNCLTLDSNMVAYLYRLTSPGITAYEYEKIKKNFTTEQINILDKIVRDNSLAAIKFYTTPQVIEEVKACAEKRHDKGILQFLENICKIKIPRNSSDKAKYAELIAELMEDYLEKNIELNNGCHELQSAISDEKKDGGIKDFADAKIVAENNILNGKPIITRNEKHLIFMKAVKQRNRLRSEAILRVNGAFLKKKEYLLPHKKIKSNLKAPLATTYRVNDIPHILDL